MKIACVQFLPIFCKKKDNIDKIISYIKNIEAELIVFPELCTTGYFFLSKEELSAYAETAEGETISAFQSLATKLDKILIIGFVEEAGGKFFNSAAILIPAQNMSRVYRKTHLFYKERFYFEPGNTGFFVIDIKDKDLRLGTMICYDWRFPESARSLGLLGADLIVMPSNLVTPVWHSVMPARALENKVYLAVANRIGTEKRGAEELLFNGGSGIWDYDGEIISRASADEERIVFADIFPEETRDKSFNEYNDIFKDRRKELYIY